MSLVAATVVLGLVVAVLVKVKQVNIAAAAVCAVFGVLLAVSPVGPNVYDALTVLGGWTTSWVAAL